MKNKIPFIISGGVILVLVAFLYLNSSKGIGSSQNTEKVDTAPTKTTASQTPSQNPQDIVPGLYKNEIQNNSTKEGFIITNALVENNIDGNGKTVDDHLELDIKNTSSQDLTNFEIYYTITDTVTGKKEGYYKKLPGFVVKQGETKALHFDSNQGDGHYGVNKNSMYYTSPNKLQFDIQASAQGYKIQTTQIFKDAGGAEVKD